MTRVFDAVVVVFCLVCFACCRDKKPKGDNPFRVEIAPSEWLHLDSDGRANWFRFSWGGESVFWNGDQKDYIEHAQCLRVWEGDLYLIVQRFTGNWNFHYYRLQDTKFVEIDRTSFPRKIATQNMEMFPQFQGPQKDIDTWELTRKLDCTGVNFLWTYTASMWCDLETGKTRIELSSEMTDEEILKITQEYKRKYSPIPLPTIVDMNDYKQ